MPDQHPAGRAAALFLLIFVFACSPARKTLYSIGDSTMAGYDVEALSKRNGGDNYPLRGWGMYLGDHFSNRITHRNKAISGISSKNFRSRGHWQKIMNSLRRGDYVLIQFGHNDQKKEDSLRYTDPRSEFGESLAQYIRDIRSKGAHPVLATSIARRAYDEKERLIDTHAAYTLAVLRLAREENVPLLDLNLQTTRLIEKAGKEGSKSFFLHIAPGVFEKLPKGLEDNTHLNEKGGKAVAELAVTELRATGSGLKRYLKD